MRVERGVPAGGQFASHRRDGDDVTLITAAANATARARWAASTAREFVFDDRRAWFDMSADYQRGSVWGADHKREYIRSLVTGQPTGTIVLAERDFAVGDEADRGVIDGKQRLIALWEFYDNELAIPASWVDESLITETETIVSNGHDVLGVRRSGLRGHTTQLSGFPVKSQPAAFDSRLSNSAMPVVAVRVGSPEEEARLYFTYNFSGVPLSSSDLERAREHKR